jgi:hypothetical protein
MTWIVDLDGTLTLRSARDWHDWHRVEEDSPHSPVVTVVRALAAVGRPITFMSGRMEQARAATVRWLHTHLCLPEVGLCICTNPFYMRADGDYRPDEVIKRELFEKHYADVEVEGVIDDRNRVVSMWREIGLVCLQVADGDF